MIKKFVCQFGSNRVAKYNCTSNRYESRGEWVIFPYSADSFNLEVWQIITIDKTIEEDW